MRQNSGNQYGQAIDVSVFDAYGRCLITQQPSSDKGWSTHRDMVGFHGQWGAHTDWEALLSPSTASYREYSILMTHRYYDPRTGRFINRDPIGYNGGINLYGYAGNNPINYADPSGLQEKATENGRMVSEETIEWENAAKREGEIRRWLNSGGLEEWEREMLKRDYAEHLELLPQAARERIYIETLAKVRNYFVGTLNAIRAEQLKSIKNGNLAGSIHPLTDVEFDLNGQALFVSEFTAEIPKELRGPNVSDGRQMRNATKQLHTWLDQNPELYELFTREQVVAIKKNKERIPDFTWHHNPYRDTLELVDRETHKLTGHDGGRKYTGGRP